MYQFISILRLPLSFLPTLLRITYEGKEGGQEKFEGETGDEEEGQHPHGVSSVGGQEGTGVCAMFTTFLYLPLMRCFYRIVRVKQSIS